MPPFDFYEITRRMWYEPYVSRKCASITVVAIANRDVYGHELAIHQTCNCIPFDCKKLMISMTPPKDRSIEWVPDVDWGEGRKKFISALGEWTLKKLVNYITTDAVIIVQSDGFAVNPKAWSDDFLYYDYIGAPFPLWLTVFMRGSMFRRVGGAGFSFRSRKFLATTAAIDYQPLDFQFEDICTSRVYYRELEEAGCRFAPVSVALRWCIEYRLEDYPSWKPADSFGHHGFDRHGKPLYQLPFMTAFLKAVARKFTEIKP